jgi:hypothetical protein
MSHSAAQSESYDICDISISAATLQHSWFP